MAPLYAHLEGSDFDAYAKSAARIAALTDAYDRAYTAHNIPVVESRYIVALDKAFTAIRAGEATDYTLTDGMRQYYFVGFSIIVNPESVAAR
jgi:hypothetical protein